MKKLIISIITICAFLAPNLIKSQTIVNLHSNGNVNNYHGVNAFTLAYNDATNGDTIYLSGGSFTPPTNINKKLTIFGSGFFADSLMQTGKTFLNSTISFQDSASGSYIEGVEFSGNITFTNNTSINNIIIKRCKINGTFNIPGNLTNPSNNLSLLENVFINTVTISNATNVILSNNIFQGYLYNSQSNFISNNIFLNSSAFYNSIQGDNNTIVNNIFLNGNLISGTGNVFSHNISTVSSSSISYGSNSTVTNTYSGVQQSSMFVNQTGNSYNFAHNYNLADPTLFSGTDATQVGIYGGNFPVKAGYITKTPHISEKNISTITNNNGEVDILIKVNAQNN